MSVAPVACSARILRPTAEKRAMSTSSGEGSEGGFHSGAALFTFDATQRIRETEWGRDMVIIAVSGWGQENDRVRSRQAGHCLRRLRLLLIFSMRRFSDQRGRFACGDAACGCGLGGSGSGGGATTGCRPLSRNCSSSFCA